MHEIISFTLPINQLTDLLVNEQNIQSANFRSNINWKFTKYSVLNNFLFIFLV